MDRSRSSRARRGVGAGIARVLAEAGATIVGSARTESEIVDSIRGIEDAGGKGLALVADAISRSDGAVVNTAMERFGRMDFLVNNVGGSTYARFLDITTRFPAYVRLVCDLRVHHQSARGPAHAQCRTRLIINISSGSARFGIRALTAYCVAKGGLEALTRGWHRNSREDSRQRHRIRFIRHRRSARQLGLDAGVAGEDAGVHAVASAGRVKTSDALRCISACAIVTRRTRHSMSTAALTEQFAAADT